MAYPFLCWEIWQCGHVTDAENGVTVSNEGELSHLPRFDVNRSNVIKRLGERCPRCYTTQMKERLTDMRGLLFDSNVNHEAMVVAESRVQALKQFCEKNIGLNFVTDEHKLKNYPPAFKRLVKRVLALEEETCAMAVEDLVAALKRRRTRIIPKFVKHIKAIQKEALAYGEDGNECVKRYVAGIVSETNATIEELEKEEFIETVLLKEVDEEFEELREIFEERKRRKAEWMQRMSNPEF
ncbi:hypothetical protein F5X97DRAFT_339029 [Nemania serpens]|nr:hypothetical protein F5X97DRAFT_339029 [Nemania serpens]